MKIYVIGYKDLEYSKSHIHCNFIGIYTIMIKIFKVPVFTRTIEIPRTIAEEIWGKKIDDKYLER